MNGQPWGARLGAWLFERVLQAYPTPFRERHAEEMRRTFLERQRVVQDSDRKSVV